MALNEVLAQVRRIEIRTRRLVTESFGGKYLSTFKGQGIEFAEVREYVPGDDIRSIDWNVTARSGRPHVRRYQDERELTVMLACDLSGSQFFGSASKFKQEIAAEIAALLTFAARRNNDKVGLFLFTDRAELYRPARKGRTHHLTLVRDLLAFKPSGHGTKLKECLELLNRHVKRRSILFIVSDFQDTGYERILKQLALKHDVVPVVLEDPRESELPSFPAWLQIEDPETGQSALVRPSAGLQKSLRKRYDDWRQELERTLRSCALESVRIRTDRSYVDSLARFFKERSRRFR